MLLNPSNYLDIADKLGDSPTIIIPILSDDIRHYCNNSLCALFIKVLDEPDSFLLPVNHNECENLSIDNCLAFLLELKGPKYMYNKKSFIQFFPTVNFNTIVDVELLYYINNNKSLENLLIPDNHIYQSISEQTIKRSFDILGINCYVPIYKLQERMEKFSLDINRVISENKVESHDSEYYYFFNNAITQFSKIERNGIFVDSKKLLHYHNSYHRHISNKNMIYSNYNLYTITGRPSNTFERLNFAALSKDDGIRSSFVSRHKNGFILMFDYDAYHLNLIANIVGYKFDTGVSIHDYLGKIYYGKDELTEEEYNKSKEASFTILYGGFDDSIAKAIPFFGKVKEFIDTMWKSYEINGYVQSPISKKKFYKKNMESMTKNKLFNYMLQEMETSRNVIIMEKLHNLLENTQTKLILYLYDAFIFDVNIDDGKELIQKIRNIMEEDGLYKTKMYYGKDFHNMKKIT